MLPALSAVVLWVIPSEKKNWIRWFAILISVVVLVLSVGVFTGFDSEAGGIQYQSSYSWLDMPGTWGTGQGAFTLTLGVDGIAALMVLLTGIVMFTGTIVSWSIETDNKDFSKWWLRAGRWLAGTPLRRLMLWLDGWLGYGERFDPRRGWSAQG